MSDDLQFILELLASPSAGSEKFRHRFGGDIDSLTLKFGDFCGPDASKYFFDYLEKDQWMMLRHWIPQADRTPFRKFLSAKVEVFFRERRKALMASAMRNTPWTEIIDSAEYLSPGYRALAQYCLVEGLSGAALKKAVRADMRCRLERTGAISTSRSNLLQYLRAYCQPHHQDMIDAVLRLRQRSGRRPKAPTRSDTSR